MIGSDVYLRGDSQAAGCLARCWTVHRAQLGSKNIITVLGQYEQTWYGTIRYLVDDFIYIDVSQQSSGTGFIESGSSISSELDVSGFRVLMTKN
jgi:hypothetical protein